MTHAHRRHAPPPSSQWPVTAVVVLFVAGIGAALYFVMRRGPEAETAQGGEPKYRPSAVTASEARDQPPSASSGVVEQYDGSRDRLKTVAHGIVLAESGGERLALDVYWTNPGRVRQRATTPLIWAVERTAAKKTLADDHAVAVAYDGKSLDVSGSTYDSQPKDDGVVEVVRFSTSLDDFLRIVAARQLVLRLGGRTLEIGGPSMDALHALAARIPGS